MAATSLALRMRYAIVLLLFAVPTGMTADASESNARRRPNVLFLITDQHHHAVLSGAGNPVVKTPNLDRLASQGVTVTRAISVTPFCSPTRASFITGQWPHTHGIVRNVTKDWHARITDDQTTLDRLLFDAGYRVRHIGKWHLGNREDLRSYRDYMGEQQERTEYRRWLEEQGDAVVTRDAHPGETFVDRLFMTEPIARAHAIWKNEPRRSKQDLSRIGRSPIAPEAQYESWLADRAIAWLERDPGKPFMLTLSVSPPHAIWDAPDPYYGMYDPKEMPLPASFYDRTLAYRESQPARMVKLLGEAGVREYLRCYYAQVTMMDDHFGRILERLHKLGLDENTLVIFTSDHGDMQGAHAMMGKSVPAFYDEIVRVPLIIRYPPSIEGGRVLDSHASSVDLMPTVLDFLGFSSPLIVQGRSLRRQLEGKGEPEDRPAFSEFEFGGPGASRMIRTREWKYAVFGRDRRELFHLAEDPHELRNLADDPNYARQRQQLEQQLREWMQQTDDPALATLFASADPISPLH